MGEVVLAGVAACADWVGVVVDAWEDGAGVAEGLLSFEEGALGEVVVEEEVELGVGHKIVEEEVVSVVGLVE